ncbi:universal stress protein [Microvirga sp. W0021]|uniref:Universal stress protein n=1 Tax=Hohaiivirga grylli TaxID=3133970 RepID=A0ABV0BL71_9HYPH
MFNTILVPVDLAETEASSLALERAIELAKISNGHLRLIYIRSVMPVTYMEFVPQSFDTEQQVECEQKLAEIAAKVPLPAGHVSAVVRMGSIYNEVLDEADKMKADLIVVGSHRPSMATYLLGSNASAIVRHAQASVLVIR